jgi:CBS domain-containing protein
MQVKDIMTSNPACCTPETMLEEVALMMIDNDCGEIPVVENLATYLPIGVVTDRDIVCRTIGKGLNPLTMTAGECMTAPPITVMPDDSIEKCLQMMEENQIRRVPVVDAGGACIGIVALADIAKNVAKKDSAEVLQEVSAASTSASSVE